MHDAKRVCENLGIKFIPGEYDLQGWLDGARGLENEPEKGARCEFCFDFRMQKTAELALSLGERKITTTLLMSPKKSHSQLCASLQRICERCGLEFIAPDFRKDGGTNEQFVLAKKDTLYHQNYCGCIYALAAQRDDQRKAERNSGGSLTADLRRNLAQGAEIYELISPLDRQILPASVEEKLKFYKKLCSLERKGVKFSVLRDRFLNYRLLRAWIKFDGRVVPSFVLFGSHFTRENVKLSIERECEIFCSDKGEIKILNLAKFNEISRSNFKSVSEMLKNPPSLARQNKTRAALCAAGSLSPIIVTDEIRAAKVQIYGLSRIFLDVREILVRI